MSSALAPAKNFATLQRQLTRAQQAHTQMKYQWEYNTMVSQLKLLTHADQL